MKLIQTDMYLLLIDEEAEINKGDYFLLSNTKINICGHEKRVSSSHSPKILAYLPLTKEAKELDLPLLPSFENFAYINELAIKHWESRIHEDMDLCCNNFIAGYKSAQSKQLENFIKTFNELWKKFGNQ